MPEASGTPLGGAEGFDEEFVRSFVEESLEHLDRVAGELLALDTDLSRARSDPELVNRLFRAVHSIKGLASMLGFAEIRELSHQTETVLDRLRRRRLEMDRSVLSLLQGAADALRAQVRAVPTGVAPAVDLAAFTREVAGILASPEPTSAESDPRTTGAPAPEVSAPARPERETVRVDVTRLDAVLNILGELAIERARLDETASRFRQRAGRDAHVEILTESVARFGALLSDLQDVAIRTRLVPVEGVFARLHRAAREISRQRAKEVRVEVSGEDTELDKGVAEEISDPLLHLVRNAVDHGLEGAEERERAGKPREGRLRLAAYQEGGRIVIQVGDDGAGIDFARVRRRAEERGLLSPGEEAPEETLTNLLFAPGFTTAVSVDEVSGRGVGLDVVRRNLMRLGGFIEIASVPGHGTTFSLKLPLTLAILPTLLVRSGGDQFAVPLASVVEILRGYEPQVQRVRGGELLPLRDGLLPLVSLEELLGRRRPDSTWKFFVVVLALAERRLGLCVEALLGQRDVVIKPLGRYLDGLPGVSGATILGEGQVVLILDAPRLFEEALAPARGSTGPGVAA